MTRPIENRLSISLPDLKRRGYFDDHPSALFEWYQDGVVVAGVQLTIALDDSQPQRRVGTLTISCVWNNEPLTQVIRMERRYSNLGVGGGVWYLICPATGQYCRTLYEGQSGFVSRHAEGGLRYKAQLYSRKDRTLLAGQDE